MLATANSKTSRSIPETFLPIKAPSELNETLDAIPAASLLQFPLYLKSPNLIHQRLWKDRLNLRALLKEGQPESVEAWSKALGVGCDLQHEKSHDEPVDRNA
jgi:hypothetical protein